MHAVGLADKIDLSFDKTFGGRTKDFGEVDIPDDESCKIKP